MVKITLTDAELLKHISENPDNCKKEWSELVERYRDNLIRKVYKALFGPRSRYFVDGSIERKQIITEELAWNTLFKVYSVAETFNPGLCNGNPMPWLCKIASNEFINKIKKGVYPSGLHIGVFEAKEEELIAGDSEAPLQTINTGKRIASVREYLTSNYTPIEIEVIISYYEHYDHTKKSQHISREKLLYFRANGISDAKRTQLIHRVKKYIKEAMENIVTI